MTVVVVGVGSMVVAGVPESVEVRFSLLRLFWGWQLICKVAFFVGEVSLGVLMKTSILGLCY